MTSHGHNYTCVCPTEARAGTVRKGATAPTQTHPGAHLSKDRADSWALDLLTAVLVGLPDAALVVPARRPQRRAAAELARDLAAARRDLSAAQAKATDMIERADYFTGLFGQVSYEAAAAKTRSRVDELRAEVQSLEEQVTAPDPEVVLPLLAQIKATLPAGGVADLAREEQAIVARMMLRRLDVVARAPTPGAVAGQALVTRLVPVWQEWITPWAPSAESVPALPLRRRPRGQEGP